MRWVLVLACAVGLVVCQDLFEPADGPQPEICLTRADILLAIDRSGSIVDDKPYYQNWVSMKRFLNHLISRIDIGLDKVRLAAVAFGNKAKKMFDLNDCYDRWCVLEKLEAIYDPNGQTATAEALEMAVDEIFTEKGGDREDVSNSLILVTDGKPNPRPEDFMDIVDRVKNSSIKVVGVGVAKADDELMRQVVSIPDERNYFRVTEYSNLLDIVNELLSNVCPPEPTPTPLPLKQADCPMVADVTLLIDRSGSITDEPPYLENWNSMQSFLADLVERLPIGPDSVRLAAVTFGNFATQLFDLDDCDDKEKVLQRFSDIPAPNGKTATYEALKLVSERIYTQEGGDRLDVQDIIVLITDGKPNPFPQDFMKLVDTLKARGIEIIGVGVAKADDELMWQVVSAPNTTHYFRVNQFRDLQRILNSLTSKTCGAPSTPAPPKENIVCARGADVVFVLDSSGSIGHDNFRKVRKFVAEVTSLLPLETGRVRVAVEAFADEANTVFHLNSFTDRETATAAIQAIPYTSGGTNTAGALNHLRTLMFNQTNGDRPGYPNVAVVLTDGSSTDRMRTIRAALKARKNAHVIAIGIGDWTAEDELHAIASYPYWINKIAVKNFDNLLVEDLSERIKNMICNDKDECTERPCSNGGRCVDGVELSHCQCRYGFVGAQCQAVCRDPADIVIAIDRSSSVNPTDFRRQLDFVRSLVESLNFDNMHRFGLLSFSSEAEVHFHLDQTTGKMNVLNSLDVLRLGGTTNLAAAIQTLTSMFSRERTAGVAKIGIIITDGRANNRTEAADVAMMARNAGITLITIGVGQSVNKHELWSISSAPWKKNIHLVERFMSLGQLRGHLLDTVCNNENECGTQPCQHRNAVCVDEINYRRCVCPQGFSGHDCSKECTGKIDVAFLVDNSGSIRRARFSLVKEYVINVTETLQIGNEGARVALISWSDQAHLLFNLDTYTNKQDVLQAISNLRHVGGKTNTAAALQMAREKVFATIANRVDAPDYAIVFTDGESNININKTLREAVWLKNFDVRVMVVGIEKGLNMYELRPLASDPAEDHVFLVPSFDNITLLVDKTASALCDDTDECEDSPCENGGVCENGFDMFKCVCPLGYSGARCQRSCLANLDVAFVLDLSGSVDFVYDVIVQFTKRLVEELPVGYEQTRVALVSYSDNARIHFYLDSFHRKSDVLNAIVFGGVKGNGETNTQEALRLMRTQIFRPEDEGSGELPDEKRKEVAVVVTDGHSTVQPHNTLLEAYFAKRQGIELYVVSVGDDAVNSNEINFLASDPETDHILRLRNQEEVSRVAGDLANRICQQ